MNALARFLVRRAPVVLGATVLVTLAAVAMMPRLAFNADVTSFLLEASTAGRDLAELQAKYGVSDPITVLLERDDGGAFNDREGFALLARARDAYAGVAGVGAVGAALPATDPLLGRPLTAEVIEALPALLLGALANGPAADLLLSDEGRLALLMVLPDGDPIAVARAAADAPLPAGVRAELAGSPVVFAEVLGMLGWFLLAIPPLVLGLLLAVFAATLGSLRHAALALLPAVLGSLWTFGLIFGLGLRVDVITVIVPIFVIVMGSADGLHLVSHLQQAAARGVERIEGVATALREVGLPMVLTTLSTAAGFLSLLATDLRPVRQLGAFVAVGIGFAGVISLLTLPALLSRLAIAPAPRARARTAAGDDAVTRALLGLAQRRWTAVALVVPLVVIAVVFLPRLHVDSDQLFFFASDHPLRARFDRVEAAFGGASPLIGEFVLDRTQPIEPQLEAIRARSRAFEALPGAARVISVADILPEVPALQRAGLLDGSVTPPLGPMVADDGVRFVLFPGPHEPADLRGWLAAAVAAPEVRLLTGTPVLFERLSRAIVRAQTGSLLLALGMVSLMLLVAYRRVGTALLALVPLVLGVATMLAFLAASGIQLNLITAVASSIVIGVGIDYAIHLIAAVEVARRERPGEDGWVRRALATAGRPIVANALGVPIGLTALWLSPLAPHGHIAALMWVAMVTSAAATLVVLPAFAPRRGVRPAAPAAGVDPVPPTD